MPPWLSSLGTRVLAQLLARKLELLLVSLSPTLTSVWFYFRTEIAQHLSDPTGRLALLTTGISISLFPLTLASYFWFRPKLKHIPSLGVHKDIKTGSYYCSRCYLKDKKSHPLKTVHHAWQCHVCGNRADNPDDPIIPIPAYSPFRPKP